MLRAAVALTAVAALAGCATAPGGNRTGATGASGSATGGAPATRVTDPNAPVIVALLAPTTSVSKGASRVAQDLTAAAEIALREHGPRNMALKVYDTHGTAAGAATAIEHAVQDGAALVLGPLLSENTRVVAPVAARAGLNVVSFSNDERVAGGNVWVLGQLPGDEMRRLFSYAASQGVTSVALVHPNDPYGDAVAAAAPQAGQETGVRVGPTVNYPRSFEGIQNSSKGNAGAIRSSGVGGVLIADGGDAVRSVGAFLGYYDVSPRRFRYLGLSRWDDQANASESTLQGGWLVNVDPGRRMAFEQKFSSILTRQPSPLAGIGYDAVVLASDALKSAAAGGPAAFSAQAITASTHEGAMGSFRMTGEGRNIRSLAVMEMTGNGPQVIDPAPSFTPGS